MKEIEIYKKMLNSSEVHFEEGLVQKKKELKKLKEKGSKLRMKLLKRLSVKDFKLFLEYDMNEFQIHLLENEIKRKDMFIELKGGFKK